MNMVGLRPGTARCRLLQARVSGLVTAIGLLLVACSSAHPARPASDATPTAVATTSASSTGSPSGGSTTDCDSVATCYTPQQLQVAYGIKPLLDRGIDGHGETVVLPELAESRVNPPWVTDMRQDMAAFDSLYHLPAARMRVDSTLAGARSPWLAFGEEVLDVEMVHALAPDATLVILLLPTNSLDNTTNTVSAAVDALRLGSTEGGVMSISAAAQIGGEHCVTRAQADSVNAALQTAASRHVTVVAASGDIGAVAEPCDVYAALAGTGTFTPVKEVNLLASDPLVLGAGGTSLTASHTTGAWQAETAFGLADGNAGSPFQASGGGFSRLFSRPGYQDGVPGIGATRGVPDVSADASGHIDLAHRPPQRRLEHDPQRRRNQRQRPDLGRAHRAGRPVRRAPPGLRQPRHLPDRPRPPATTRPSTTSPRETTPWSSRPRRSPATGPRPAGIRSPAGAAPTPRFSSRCSPGTPTHNSSNTAAPPRCSRAQ